MSSSHESVGDLVPQDMLEVFAQEKLSKRSKRSRRRGTFSRAFTWLKGRRRKAHRLNKDINIDLLVSGSPLEIPLLPPIKAPNKNSETPLPVQHVHKNVFIEGNRPKHVEDLHIEAQEGLKLLQQDENRNGVDYQDDQSVVSTLTARTDDDMSFSELGMSECESTTADTISTRSMRSTLSTISYQSSRSGLTRQGSTFRPLKEDRKHAKSKSKRRAMCNIPGMPRHVQKELGLDRVAWTASQFTDAQLSNGGVSISTVVPTLDGISIASNPEGALMLLQNMNSAQAIKENIPQLPLGIGQRDDHSLLWQLLPQSSDPQKPGSLAAPWVNTSASSPSSPVIFVSPEATYMSKIIPNAILPPSVDVVELKRNRSHSSVRMVSKSSLASASPAPTRASSRASHTSSRPSSRFSSRLSSRASSYRTAPQSQCSEWSNSESSETLVSDSSTISSSSTPRVASRTSQVEITDGPLKLNDNKIVVLGKHAQLNSGNKQEESWKKAETTGPFGRSLSVTKRSKKPPPPPSRSMSLNMKHSHTVAPKSENQSLILIDKSSGSKDNGSWKIESPYSSYTHQNDMPTTVLSKTSNNEFSHWTKLKNSLPYIKGLSTKGAVPSPSLMALMALLDIPDPPIVLAPPPPPPETWAHNQRTFELLCGPGPVNFEAWAQKRGLKIEHQKPLGYIPKSVSVPGTSLSVKLNEKVVSTFTEKSEQSKEKFQRNKAINGMKDNFVAPNKKTQSQNTITLIMKRNTPTSMPVDTQSINSNAISLSSLTQLYPSPCPSPPPGNQVKLISDASTQKAQIVLPVDELICPPPHPLFPPPPPPVKETSSLLLHAQHETDTSYPAPKKSSPLMIPPPPLMIPPPPLMIPPPPLMIPPPPLMIPPPPLMIPPPPQAIPPPPQLIPLPPQASQSSPQVIQVSSPKVIQSSPEKNPSPPKAIALPTKEIPPQQEDSLEESRLTSAFNVPPPPPPPPPLPTDFKKEVKLITTDKQDKEPHQTPLTLTTKEESSTPMVTQSLLQMVRLRSIKSNVGRVEDSSVEIPKQQSNQEAPQKPIRRSLILSNPDLLSSSTSDPKDDAQTTTNQSTPPPLNIPPVMKPKIQSGKTVQDAAFSDMTKSTSQTSVADQKIQNASFESPKQSVPYETAHILRKSDPKPNITVQKIQNEVPEPSAAAEPVTQLITTDVKTEIIAQKTPNGCNKTENMPNKILLQSLPKPQSVTPTSPKVSPTHKVPPASGVLSSMRLQEAIRLKTAAMSSKDSQAKRLSLHSPPPSAGGISPTSTANFIFSKSTKKVVIETASSPEWISMKHTDSQNKNAKMPPPIAKKPRTKSEHTGYNSSETKSNTDTEHVQTAGKRAHPE